MSEAVAQEPQHAHPVRTTPGPISELLLQLAAHCRSSRGDPDELDASCCVLLQLVPDRAAAEQLLAAQPAVGWSAANQSPYAGFIPVLRCILDGHGLMPGATRSQRHLHQRLAGAYGPPAAVARLRLCMENLEQRYPRLLRAMRDAAILSHGEAQSALYLLLQVHPSARLTSSASCEAVAHGCPGGDPPATAVSEHAPRADQAADSQLKFQYRAPAKAGAFSLLALRMPGGNRLRKPQSGAGDSAGCTIRNGSSLSLPQFTHRGTS